MTQTQVDKRCGRQFKEARCETTENESNGQRGMGINYKGSQGQTERAIALQEEDKVLKLYTSNLMPITYKLICAKIKTEILLAWDTTKCESIF